MGALVPVVIVVFRLEGTEWSSRTNGRVIVTLNVVDDNWRHWTVTGRL